MFKYAGIPFASILYFLLLFFIINSQAHAKDVSVCNASPVKAHLATGFDRGGVIISRGWFHVEPGQCIDQSGVSGNNFYYRAESYSALALWLNDGSPIIWSSSLFNRLCANHNKFELVNTPNCVSKLSFIKQTVVHEKSVINFFESNHKGINSNRAPELARVLTGRMENENSLKRRAGRENPFQIGIVMKEHALGVEIASVLPGMPAEKEGLEASDIITELDGYKILKMNDVVRVVKQIPILRTTPLALTVIRNGETIEGTISPLFYEFNHPDYSTEGEVGSGIWAFFDGAALGFGNEAGCGIFVGLIEGVSSLVGDRKFDTKGASSAISGCSNELNTALAEREILYKGTTTAANWASLIVPGIPLGKFAKILKNIPLAARSRKVVR